MFTGVYNTSRKALVPTPSASSAASLAFLATLAAPWLLDSVVPTIITAACTRVSTPPGASVQPLVGSGSVTLEKTRTSLGYASGRLPIKRRWLPTCRDNLGGIGAPTPIPAA